jgi:hypothetical protein
VDLRSSTPAKFFQNRFLSQAAVITWSHSGYTITSPLPQPPVCAYARTLSLCGCLGELARRLSESLSSEPENKPNFLTAFAQRLSGSAHIFAKQHAIAAIRTHSTNNQVYPFCMLQSAASTTLHYAIFASTLQPRSR